MLLSTVASKKGKQEVCPMKIISEIILSLGLTIYKNKTSVPSLIPRPPRLVEEPANEAAILHIISVRKDASVYANEILQKNQRRRDRGSKGG